MSSPSGGFLNCQEGYYACLEEITWQYYRPDTIDIAGEPTIRYWWTYSIEMSQELEAAYDKRPLWEWGRLRFDFVRMRMISFDTGREIPIRRTVTNFWPY